MLSFIFDFKRKDETPSTVFMYSSEKLREMTDTQFQVVVDWSLSNGPFSGLNGAMMSEFLDRVIAEMKRRS